MPTRIVALIGPELARTVPGRAGVGSVVVVVAPLVEEPDVVAGAPVVGAVDVSVAAVLGLDEPPQPPALSSASAHRTIAGVRADRCTPTP